MPAPRAHRRQWAEHLKGLEHARVAAETPVTKRPELDQAGVGRRLRVGKKSQRLEALPLLIWQLRSAGAPAFEMEFRFHDVRQWRSDIAWPDRQLLVEYEGGIHTGGGHVRGRYYEDNCRKYNAAALLGYRVLRYTYDLVESGEAVSEILEALRQ